MVDLSVVIDADPVNSAVGLVSGLDQQSLSARRFDVIVVDRGLDENQREALRRVATGVRTFAPSRARTNWKQRSPASSSIP